MEENQKNNKKCDICEEPATNLCFKCQNYFCEVCYKIIHERKKNNGHQKHKIDYFVPIDIKCPDHPNVPYNLFCLDEKGNCYLLLIFIIYRTLLLILLFFKSS